MSVFFWEDLEEFAAKYQGLKNADIVTVECGNGERCVHPEQPNIRIGKGAAIKNFRKHQGHKFICGKCDMTYDNPMTKVGKGKRSKDKLEEPISVICPFCGKTREMTVACYTGDLSKEPYIQIDGSCAQIGKTISEEQKAAISENLTGRELSPEHIEKILAWRKEHPEWAEKVKQNLVPGAGAGWNKGKETPNEVKEKISKGNKGKKRTLQQRLNVSLGRKAMLAKRKEYVKCPLSIFEAEIIVTALMRGKLSDEPRDIIRERLVRLIEEASKKNNLTKE